MTQREEKFEENFSREIWTQWDHLMGLGKPCKKGWEQVLKKKEKEREREKSRWQKFPVFKNSINTNHHSFLLGRAGLPHGEDASSNRHLSPHAAFRFPAAKRTSRVHDQNAIRRQAVDLSILLPLRRLLLQKIVQGYKDAQLMHLPAVSLFRLFQRIICTNNLTLHYAHG